MYACIVTCGGLCPGLNTVIREIVSGLYYMYGVNKVIGIEVSTCVFHICSNVLSLFGLVSPACANIEHVSRG